MRRREISGVGQLRGEKDSAAGQIPVPGEVLDPLLAPLRPLAVVEDQRFRSGPEETGFTASLQKFETWFWFSRKYHY